MADWQTLRLQSCIWPWGELEARQAGDIYFICSMLMPSSRRGLYGAMQYLTQDASTAAAGLVGVALAL